MRQMAEGRRRHRSRAMQGCHEGQHDRWLIVIVLKLVVKAVHELPAGSELPRQLPEHFVRLTFAWLRRQRPRLAVVVAKILIATEKPHAITSERTADAGGEISVSRARVSGLLIGTGNRKSNRLTGQAGRLPV